MSAPYFPFCVETEGHTGEVTLDEVLQPGIKQVAAGYILYGPSTMLVLSTGQGVHGFTLDPGVGEFLLSHPDMRILPSRAIFIRSTKATGKNGMRQPVMPSTGSTVAKLRTASPILRVMLARWWPTFTARSSTAVSTCTRPMPTSPMAAFAAFLQNRLVARRATGMAAYLRGCRTSSMRAHPCTSARSWMLRLWKKSTPVTRADSFCGSPRRFAAAALLYRPLTVNGEPHVVFGN